MNEDECRCESYKEEISNLESMVVDLEQENEEIRHRLIEVEMYLNTAVRENNDVLYTIKEALRLVT